MRRLAVLVTALALGLVCLTSTQPASAQPTGTMNRAEFDSVCTLDIIDQSGHVLCLRGTFQSEVENLCNCTGDIVNTYTQNGHDFKTVRYYSPYVEDNWLVYRQRDTGKWEAKSKYWRVGSGRTALAALAPDPTACTGYAEPRVFLEAQDWWKPTISGTEDFGHDHLGICFPLNQPVAGVVHFDFVVQLHENPGVLQNVRIHLLDGNGQNHQVVSVKVGQTAAQHCPSTPDQCTWIIPVDLNTNVSTTDGYVNFRAASIVMHPGDGGTKQFAGTAWPLLLNNGKTFKSSISPTRIAGSSWYTGSLYEEAEFTSVLPPTVSGVWSPTVNLHPGAGGKAVDHSFASLDPHFHAIPLDQGTVLLDRAGPYKGPLTIDTTTLANGPHKLFLRADSPCDGSAGNDCGVKPEGGTNNVSTHSSVQVVTFVVNN
jgi:hypothetical protein